MKTKRNNLLILKDAIESEIEKAKMPLATIRSILSIFGDCLIMDKNGETIQKEVADYFKKYNFINVTENGIGWTIAYGRI